MHLLQQLVWSVRVSHAYLRRYPAITGQQMAHVMDLVEHDQVPRTRSLSGL